MDPGAFKSAVTLVQIPSLLWAFWSFQMYKNTSVLSTAGKSVFDHGQNGALFTTGVCPFGKFGAWMILLWTLTQLALMFALSPSDYPKIGYAHISFVSIVFGLTLIMNWPLFVRTLPYCFLQTAVAIMLIS